MNKKIITIALACLMLPISARADWGSFFKGLARAASGAVAGAILEQSCVADGYSKEEAKRMTNDFFNAIEVNTNNVNKGIDFIEAESRYDRQNIIKDVVFDFAAEMTDDPTSKRLIQHYRQEADAQITYLSEREKATTDEERKAAFDKRTRTYANLYYNAYQDAKEAHARHLAEKLQIKKKLMQKGYDDSMADEVAGSILAVQKSDLSQSEKEEILRSYDFIGSTSEIQYAAKQVANDNSNSDAEALARQQEAERQRIEAERQRKLEEERKEAERRAAEEKRIALEKIVTIAPCDYTFDVIGLSVIQKQQLDEVADILKKYPDVSVLLTGHTCKIGYKSINMKKGLERANAAKDYLLEKGVPEQQIQVESKGELEPISDNNTKEGRAQNRRVVISLINK